MRRKLERVLLPQVVAIGIVLVPRVVVGAVPVVFEDGGRLELRGKPAGSLPTLTLLILAALHQQLLKGTQQTEYDELQPQTIPGRTDGV